jgi:hypothetical protein
MIIVLAGRRIDAPDAATSRFPLKNVGAVAEKLKHEFSRLNADTIVCSAACGADLIALHVAKNLEIRRRIVLPFDGTLFREKSVTDRPGNEAWNWGKLFDELSDDARQSGDLVIIKSDGKGDTDAFKEANKRIFEEAKTLLASRMHNTEGKDIEKIAAVVIWEGSSRGEDDLTMEFAERAKANGFRVVPILTIDENGGGV